MVRNLSKQISVDLKGKYFFFLFTKKANIYIDTNTNLFYLGAHTWYQTIKR
jgi:hypothetical protein